MAKEKDRFPLGDLPRGFSFEGNCFEEFLRVSSAPPERMRRRLPRPEEGPFPALALLGIPLSEGPLWKALSRAFDALRPGGDLFLRVPNARAWHRVKTALEGRSSLFAPAGAPHDPLLAASREDVARGLFYAGFVTREIADVPGMDVVPGREVLEALWECDLDGASLEREARVEWFFVHARREEPLAGSVLLAAESPGEGAETKAYLEGILPPRWEVVVSLPREGEEAGECELWNRAFSRSRGDRIWLLRAGQRPPAGWLSARLEFLFRKKTCLLPEETSDLAGLLIHRKDLAAFGPLPWFWKSAAVAAEEFRLWMVHAGMDVRAAGEPIPGPAGSAAGAEREAREFMERWSWQARESRVAEERRSKAEVPWKGREPRVSLCMMVRNEESCLERCLESALGAVDEIVVVDTGSTDRTVEIARSFGAKVVEFPWNGSFSEPRNAGLKECKGDWILVLDADEELAPGSAEKIREAVKDPTVAAYHLTFRNLNDGKERTRGVRITRLFRNLPGISFSNRIHEQVIHSLMERAEPLGLVVKETDVEVIHHGYVSRVMEKKGKKERNWELFEKQVEEKPEDHYSWYKFGDFLRRFGTPEQSREKFRKALELIERLPDVHLRQVPYAAEVATLLALEEAKKENYEKAEELLLWALDRFMATPNTWYIAAGVALRTGKPGLALELYDRCLGFHDAVLVVPVEDGLSDYASWHAMGAAWSMKGFPRRAREYMEAALSVKPDYLPGVLGYTALLLQEGDPGRAVAVLGRYLKKHPGEEVVRRQGAAILEKLGLREQAEAWRRGAPGGVPPPGPGESVSNPIGGKRI